MQVPMLVTVEEQSKLKRKLTIEIPLSEVQSTYDQVFAQIKSNVRVNGFRPGKYPRQLAEKRFKALMAQEALQTLIPKYLDLALKEKDLRPATEPRFENVEVDKQKPLKFDVQFEIFPPFDLLPASEFSLADQEPVVTPEGVQARLDEMRRSRGGWEDRGQEPAQAGDVVSFDFEATVDGKTFDGGSGQNQRIEIGSPRFLPEFDAQFPGIVAGQEKEFPLTFPADYRDTTLAGKTAQFKVQAHKVERRTLAELNAEFFKAIDEKLDSEAALIEHLTAEMRREAEQAILQTHRDALTEQIRAKYSFEVPETAVEGMLHQYEHELADKDPQASQDEKRLVELKAEQRPKAEAELRLGYVVDAYSRQHGVRVNPEELRQRFYLQAYMMRQNPDQLVQTRYGEQLLGYTERRMLREHVLSHLAYTVLGKPLPPELLPAPEPAPEHDPGHGHEHEHVHSGHEQAAGR